MTGVPLRPDLLTRPAEEAVRVTALSRLDEAAAALARLEAGDDAEALHDFRVALRRLRSLLRAYRPLVGAAARKPMRRRLRRLAAATNAGRDAEVLLAWLRGQEEGLATRERVGWRWLVAQLEARRATAEAALPALRAGFGKVERRLRPSLGSYQLTVDLSRGVDPTGPHFGAVAGAAARVEAEVLERRLSEVSADEPTAVHSARISAKRLRYVLEPVAGDSVVVARLRDLQDRLGDLNDARVAKAELATAVQTAGAERARLLFERALVAADGPPPRRRDERSGLVALARRAGARWDRAFARLEAEWLNDRAAPFLRDVSQLAAGLETPSSGNRAAADPWTSGPRAARRRRRFPRPPSGG